MIPQIVSEFEKVEDSKGQEFFSGVLDIGALRKMADKRKEVRVVLMRGNLLPESVRLLTGNDPKAQANLFMFAETSAQTNPKQSRGSGSKTSRPATAARNGINEVKERTQKPGDPGGS